MMENSKCSDVSRSNSSSIANQSEKNFQFREETFPIDTVKQIYDDIEKLFDSEDSSIDNNNSNYQGLLMVAKTSMSKPPQPITYNNNIIKSNDRHYNVVVNKSNKQFATIPIGPKQSSLNHSTVGGNSGDCRSDLNRFNFLLNEINQCTENNLSLFDYVQLCSFELDCLEAEIEYQMEQSGDSTTSTRTNCGQTKKWTPKLNELHILLWNLFNLHEKLSSFCSNAATAETSKTTTTTGSAGDQNITVYYNNSSSDAATVSTNNNNNDGYRSGDHPSQHHNPLRLALIEKIQQTGEIWYGIAEKIKDTITMTRSVDDFLASIRQTKQFHQLWLLTRSIRTLYFLIGASSSSSKNNNNNNNNF